MGLGNGPSEHLSALQSGPGPLNYGAKSFQNSRKLLEDAYSAHELNLHLPSALAPSGDPSLGSFQYYGVFDGHGGPEAAQHAAQKLHLRFQEALERQSLQSASSDGGSSVASSTPSATANADAFLSEAWPGSGSSGASSSDMDTAVDLASAEAGTPTGGSGAWWANSVRSMPTLNDRYSRNVKKALHSAFISTDAELAGTEVGDCVGTTAVVAVVGKTEVFVAHCGDSRAVLCRKGGAIPLTSDHKPDRADEAARVAALGGKVVVKGGTHRVMGLLAMTRAIGDHFLRPYVIPAPEVTCLPRTHEDELLLLASDGLWDVFSCQEATTLALRSTMRARERGASSSAACRVGASVLVRGAIERGSKDNITVLVIDLRRHESAGSVASVLASQCSDAIALGFPHRRKRSSSGGDEELLGGQPGAADENNSSRSIQNNSCRDSSRSCGGGLPAMTATAVQPFASVFGSYWGDVTGAASRYRQPQQSRPHLPYQQPPRQTHMEALASTWAAATAVFSGRPMRSSSSPGGPSASGSAAIASNAARPSEPGAVQSVNATTQGSPFVSSGVANTVVNSASCSSSSGQPLNMRAIPATVTASAAASGSTQSASQQQQQQPQTSPCAMRSHSFSTFELDKRSRRQSDPVAATGTLNNSQQQPPQQQQQQQQEIVIPRHLVSATTVTPLAAVDVFSGGSCCSAEKPPLPRTASVHHH